MRFSTCYSWLLAATIVSTGQASHRGGSGSRPSLVGCEDLNDDEECEPILFPDPDRVDDRINCYADSPITCVLAKCQVNGFALRSVPDDDGLHEVCEKMNECSDHGEGCDAIDLCGDYGNNPSIPFSELYCDYDCAVTDFVDTEWVEDSKIWACEPKEPVACCRDTDCNDCDDGYTLEEADYTGRTFFSFTPRTCGIQGLLFNQDDDFDPNSPVISSSSEGEPDYREAEFYAWAHQDSPPVYLANGNVDGGGTQIPDRRYFATKSSDGTCTRIKPRQRA